MSQQTTKQDVSARHAGTMKVATYEPDPHLAEYTHLRYDYGQVTDKHRRLVQDAAVDINRRQQRARQDMLAIGRRLIEVKEVLPHGQFEAWAETEFEMTARTAQNMMNVSRAYADEAKAKRVSLLSDSALYLLAAPSTPDSARDEVESLLLESAKLPTRDEVKRIIDAHKPAPKMIDVQATMPTVDEPKAKRVSLLEDHQHATPPPAMPADLAAAGYRLVQVDSSYWVWEIGDGDETFRSNWMDSPAAAIEDAQSDHIGNAPAAEPTPEQRRWQQEYEAGLPTPDELEAMAVVAAERADEDAERVERAAQRENPAYNAPEPVAPRALVDPFDAWLNAMPSGLNLRECGLILDMAKMTAKHALELQPSLYNAVYGALPTWSHLIREVGKAAGR